MHHPRPLRRFSDALSFEGQRRQLLDTFRHVLEGEEARPGDETVCASSCAFSDGFLGSLDPTIDFDVDIQISVDDPLPDLANLAGHGGDVLLATESRVDGHDQDVIDQIQDVLDHLRGGVRVQRDRRGSAGGPDAGKGPVQVGAGFDVDDDDSRFPVGALGNLRESVQHEVGALLADHELRLERQLGILAAPSDGVRAEC